MFSVTPVTEDLVELCSLQSILMYVFCKPHKVKIEFSEERIESQHEYFISRSHYIFFCATKKYHRGEEPNHHFA